MNDYEQKCIDLDKQLGELLGWSEVSIFNSTKEVCGVFNGFYSVRNRWTQDDAEAFGLMVEHEIDLDYNTVGVKATNSDNIKEYYDADFLNFDSKSDAVRFAIVQAVINKLKGA